MAMAESGDMLDLSGITDYAIDKHSSGGVGDKTSLIVLPLVASFGVPIAKMSGRGLGFGGGTLDKLESIRGYDVNLSEDEFRRIARETGIVLSGQSKSLAPADGKLYVLRDVTGTVASLPLIASSIMSKKLAAGTNGIVLDVKLGCGAFMKTLDEARALATAMVQIGVDAGRDMVALLSDMNQPLGVAVGMRWRLPRLYRRCRAMDRRASTTTVWMSQRICCGWPGRARAGPTCPRYVAKSMSV